MATRILVTGGTGYIGSHTVAELLSKEYEVLIVDNLSNSKIEVLDNIEEITGIKPGFIQMDLCDKERLIKVFQGNDIDAIIHFAASKAVGESVDLPLKYYQNNVGALLNLIEVMQANKVNPIVFSSSCTVYGQPDELPVTEQTLFQSAESPYGNTKQICEEILRDYSKANTDFQSIALRYFNPVGAHESALIGELPLGMPNNLVPYVTQTAAGLRDCLQIFGDDYDTKDGTAVRDYIHVVDLAKAHVMAIERLLEKSNKSNFEYFNLGTGNGYSVLELVNVFERVNQVKVNHKIVSRREGDIEKIYADTSFANKELGWKATLGLNEMMKSAWAWQKKCL